MTVFSVVGWKAKRGKGDNRRIMTKIEFCSISSNFTTLP